MFCPHAHRYEAEDLRRDARGRLLCPECRSCAVCGCVTHVDALVYDMCPQCRAKCDLCGDWYQITDLMRTRDGIFLACDDCAEKYDAGKLEGD